MSFEWPWGILSWKDMINARIHCFSCTTYKAHEATFWKYTLRWYIWLRKCMKLEKYWGGFKWKSSYVKTGKPRSTYYGRITHKSKAWDELLSSAESNYIGSTFVLCLHKVVIQPTNSFYISRLYESGVFMCAYEWGDIDFHL